MQQRTLGRTGERVSILGIGDFHLSKTATDGEAVRIVRTAIENGVNFLDNAWDNADGESERRMGLALRDGYRGKAFLMTKIDGRDAQAARSQLDVSLRRLHTDVIDLLQFHEVIRTEDADRIFAPGGALETADEARAKGKIRYIGFTGHKSPSIHLHMLDVAELHGFHFDTVQMPLNVMDAHHESFEQAVLPAASSKHIGVIGMKPMGDPFILDSKAVTAVECLRYAMSLPVSVTITGVDSMRVLQQALDVAEEFKPLSSEERAKILARTAVPSVKGVYERYKSSDHFDSTAKHPEWLGSA